MLQEYALLGDPYHLVLTHLVHDSQEYADFYRSLSRLGHYTILDNSAHEFGFSASLDSILRAAHLIEPSEIVLPDRLFFGDDTLRDSSQALERFRKEFPDAKLMGAPQGRILWEFMACYEGLIDLGVDTIGLPKIYEVWTDGLLGLARRFGKTIDIHLLGWGRDSIQLCDLSFYGGPNIRGIDSAKPLVYAAAGIKLNPIPFQKQPPYPGRPANFFQLTRNDFDRKLAYDNISAFRKWARSLQEGENLK